VQQDIGRDRYLYRNPGFIAKNWNKPITLSPVSVWVLRLHGIQSVQWTLWNHYWLLHHLCQCRLTSVMSIEYFFF